MNIGGQKLVATHGRPGPAQRSEPAVGLCLAGRCCRRWLPPPVLPVASRDVSMQGLGTQSMKMVDASRSQGGREPRQRDLLRFPSEPPVSMGPKGPGQHCQPCPQLASWTGQDGQSRFWRVTMGSSPMARAPGLLDLPRGPSSLAHSLLWLLFVKDTWHPCGQRETKPPLGGGPRQGRDADQTASAPSFPGVPSPDTQCPAMASMAQTHTWA